MTMAKGVGVIIAPTSRPGLAPRIPKKYKKDLSAVNHKPFFTF